MVGTGCDLVTPVVSRSGFLLPHRYAAFLNSFVPNNLLVPAFNAAECRITLVHINVPARAEVAFAERARLEEVIRLLSKEIFKRVHRDRRLNGLLLLNDAINGIFMGLRQQGHAGGPLHGRPWRRARSLSKMHSLRLNMKKEKILEQPQVLQLQINIFCPNFSEYTRFESAFCFSRARFLSNSTYPADAPKHETPAESTGEYLTSLVSHKFKRTEEQEEDRSEAVRDG